MAETQVKVPDGSIITVRHPEGAAQNDIFEFANQQWHNQKAPEGPDLSALTPGAPGTPYYPEGVSAQPQKSEPRGIAERVGTGISSGFGESRVSDQEHATYPLAASVAKTLELPGRVAGAVAGGVAGAAAGALEQIPENSTAWNILKMVGLEPTRVNMDRFMRDAPPAAAALGSAGTLAGGVGPKPAAIERGRPKVPTPEPEPPPSPLTPAGPGALPIAKPEQSQLLSPIGRAPAQQVATEVGEALQAKRGEMRADVNRQYAAALDAPGELAPGSMQGTSAGIRKSAEAAGVLIDDKLTPGASAALKVLDATKGFGPGKGADPMAPLTGKAPTPSPAVTLREVDVARRRMNELYSVARKDPTDLKAFRHVMEEFGKKVEDVIAEGLFDGDSKLLDQLKAARAASAREKKLFGEGARRDDDAGTAMRKIVEGNRTPQEIANYLYGADKIGAKGTGERLLNMIATALGPDHPTIGKIKLGMWDKALSRPKGVAELVNSTIGKKLFPPEELNLMRQYVAMKELPVAPKYKPAKGEPPAALPTPGVLDQLKANISAAIVSTGVAKVLNYVAPGVGTMTKPLVKKMIMQKPETAPVSRRYGGTQ